MNNNSKQQRAVDAHNCLTRADALMRLAEQHPTSAKAHIWRANARVWAGKVMANSMASHAQKERASASVGGGA